MRVLYSLYFVFKGELKKAMIEMYDDTIFNKNFVFDVDANNTSGASTHANRLAATSNHRKANSRASSDEVFKGLESSIDAEKRQSSSLASISSPYRSSNSSANDLNAIKYYGEDED